MEKTNSKNAKLALIPYKATKTSDIINGSLALVRNNNEMFFINDDIIKIEKQFESASGTFSLQDGAGIELLEMFLVAEEDCGIGEQAYDLYSGQIKEVTENKDFHYEFYKIIAKNEQVSNATIRREAIVGEGRDMSGDYVTRIVSYQIRPEEIKEIMVNMSEGEDVSIETENNKIIIFL